MGFDTRAVLALNSLARGASAPLWSFLSEYGLYAFGLWGLGAMLRARTHREGDAGRTVLLAWFSAGLVAESLVKPWLRSPRPTSVPALRAQLHVLGPVPGPRSLGLPSGTAAMCAAAALCVYFAWGRRAGALAGTLALAVSLSRVIAGVHWPSDLAGGFVVGGLVGLAALRANERVEGRRGWTDPSA